VGGVLTVAPAGGPDAAGAILGACHELSALFGRSLDRRPRSVQ